LKARAWIKVDVSRRLRYALEVRHKSFMTPEFFDLLREHNIAFVFADTARKFPYAEDLTGDLVPGRHWTNLCPILKNPIVSRKRREFGRPRTTRPAPAGTLMGRVEDLIYAERQLTGVRSANCD
jgi:hypothetical protein